MVNEAQDNIFLWLLKPQYHLDFCVFYFIYFNLYFIYYAVTAVPIFPPLPPSPSTLYSLRQFPHHCSCPWVMGISSLASTFPILYFTSPWLFCNYQFVLLNPLISSPIPSHHTSYLANHQKHSLYQWFCLCSSCFLSFLESVVDRYVFVAMLLLIILIFFLLNKSL